MAAAGVLEYPETDSRSGKKRGPLLYYGLLWPIPVSGSDMVKWSEALVL